MIKLNINVWRFGKHFVVDYVFILNSNLVGEINPNIKADFYSTGNFARSTFYARSLFKCVH